MPQLGCYRKLARAYTSQTILMRFCKKRRNWKFHLGGAKRINVRNLPRIDAAFRGLAKDPWGHPKRSFVLLGNCTLFSWVLVYQLKLRVPCCLWGLIKLNLRNWCSPLFPLGTSQPSSSHLIQWIWKPGREMGKLLESDFKTTLILSLPLNIIPQV